MNNKLTGPGRIFAYKQCALISILVLLCSLLLYVFLGKTTAISALVGGAIGVLPNILFAYKAFKYAGAKSSKKVVESFFSGVKLKMALTAFLFALAFKFLVIVPLPFFAMFCLVMAMPLVTPFVIKHES
ncbi:ATP synthase subunit I [Colwellia sp. D2M02]|uniref:F0F1 ATP synthase subunit I n=1 Tax=Colwellia asteriadis TaxID=517723 RepID=A0ABN1L3Q0_9GAMM|nr:ATP synthase subunit I [Colwellia sp. D2M02]MBU2891787.1 ATP synthase subunit I [Colwellia sp. D2M02]